MHTFFSGFVFGYSRKLISDHKPGAVERKQILRTFYYHVRVRENDRVGCVEFLKT